MRLTLRTLLAYLDNTLEPQDAEILRQKVEQSGFATQLVQRIRASVADGSLSAPAPDSVHPIEEPNMMSNYLDSTLSPEQVAEIEKACLESLPHLAEAAACHQILSMVLSRPAEGSDQLRKRIFSMVDSKGSIRTGDAQLPPADRPHDSKSAIAGEIGPRFSGVEMPSSDGWDVDLGGQNAAAADLPDGVDLVDDGPQEVQPVGLDDSGVFKAVTKFRDQSNHFASTGTELDDPDLHSRNSALNQLDRKDLYEAESKTKRVTPWIVSLALVAVLIFAIVKIFAPLIAPSVAQKRGDAPVVNLTPDDQQQDLVDQDTVDQNTVPEEASDAATGAPADVQPAEGQRNNVNTATASDVASSDDSDSEAQATSEGPDADENAAQRMPETPDSGSDDADPTDSDSVASTGPSMPSDDSGDANVSVDADDANSTDVPASPAEMPDERIASLPDNDAMDNDAKNQSGIEGAADNEVAAPRSTDQADGEGTAAVASFVSENELVAKRVGDANWKLLSKDELIEQEDQIVCGPEFRGRFALTSIPEVSVSLVGPSKIQFVQAAQTVDLKVHFGQGLVRLSQPGQTVSLTVVDDNANEETFVAATESGEAVLAYQLHYQRELGADPMVPENRALVLHLTAVEGEFAVTGLKQETDLPEANQIRVAINRGQLGEATVSQPERLPSWIDPEIDTGTLESDAAADLLELVRADEADSLLLSLRVALGFRRNEVAALAGKTMLALGDATAYFGVDGLFSNPKQRLYWSSHLDAVRQMVDRSVEDAAAVRTAMAGPNAAMDHADGDTLFRLLVGYSQDQLKTGGDAELVADLESASIPVRVLAAEHLRDISGTTLFFKPEEQVASRREEIVKKWKVRLRKESIRYPETE